LLNVLLQIANKNGIKIKKNVESACLPGSYCLFFIDLAITRSDASLDVLRKYTFLMLPSVGAQDRTRQKDISYALLLLTG
jgi:hypothetical protein